MSKVYLLIPLKIFTSRPEYKYTFLQRREDVFLLLSTYQSPCYNPTYSCLIIRLLFQASLNQRYRSTCTWSAPKKEIESLRKLEKAKAKASSNETTDLLRKFYLNHKTIHETEKHQSSDTCHVSQERILKGYVCTQISDQPSYYPIGLGLPIPSSSYLATEGHPQPLAGQGCLQPLW